jgi:hypothetical protein
MRDPFVDLTDHHFLPPQHIFIIGFAMWLWSLNSSLKDCRTKILTLEAAARKATDERVQSIQIVEFKNTQLENTVNQLKARLDDLSGWAEGDLGKPPMQPAAPAPAAASELRQRKGA